MKRGQNLKKPLYGCEAGGSPELTNASMTPVCMGGVAIQGCANGELCAPLLLQREQIDNSSMITVPFLDDEGRVRSAPRAPSRPLIDKRLPVDR